MWNWSLKIGLLVATLAVSQTLLAGYSVLAGTFEGSESKTKSVWPDYEDLPPIATQQIKFTVSTGATYRLEDVYDYWSFQNEGNPGLNMITALYQGGFDPQQPALNRLGSDQYSTWPRQLQAGIEYTLVLQSPSLKPKGVWTLVMNGPGEVNSTARVDTPTLGQGKFSGSEPKIENPCSGAAAISKVEGPFRVSRQGVYYFTNLSYLSTASEAYWSTNLCYGIYSVPPNPQNPELNKIGVSAHNLNYVNLQADTDYYLLVQSTENQLLDYFFLIVPPAPFAINPWMSGLWADPETDGQGLMLNVYPSIDALHLAWFTYDLERPGNQMTAQLGEPGHRWLTAFGGLEGAGSQMTVTRTQGGVFDATQPVPQQIQDGSIQLNFSSCTEGTLAYDLGSANTVGQLILKRPFEDAANIDRCILANTGPGIPGPL